MSMIRILVADDHAVVREGVKRIVTDTSDLVVAAEAGQSQEVLSKVAARTCDVVLLDISMPGRSGLEILQQLKRAHPALPVLVFSVHPENQYALRAFKAGASGYLTKDSIPEELVTAIRKVVRGGRYVSPSLAEHLVLEVTTGSDKPPHASLSDREYQVLCLLASGKTVTEIAKELSLSVKTVSTHRSRILAKMHMKTNAELMHYAIRHRLVE
jgi:two-component system, NarL family, invasion response regulator UvrY